MATFIQSGTGQQVTTEQIKSGSFPANTFFIEFGTGKQLTKEQITKTQEAPTTPTTPVRDFTGISQTEIDKKEAERQRQLEAERIRNQEIDVLTSQVQNLISAGTSNAEINEFTQSIPANIRSEILTKFPRLQDISVEEGGVGLQETIQERSEEFNNLAPELQNILSKLSRQLDDTIEAGQVINPDVELSPAVLQQFLDQATSELDPFFQEQIGQVREDINISIGRLQEDFEREVSEAEAPFQRGLAARAEQEAGAGLAFSTARREREQQAVTEQQQRLTGAERGVTRGAEDIARRGERQIGSEAFGGIQRRTIGQFQAGVGGFQETGRRQLFAPTGQLLGQIPKQQEVAVRGRASQLEQARKRTNILNLRNF